MSEEVIVKIVLFAIIHFIVFGMVAAKMMDDRFKFSGADWFMRAIFILSLPEIVLFAIADRNAQRIADWLTGGK